MSSDLASSSTPTLPVPPPDPPIAKYYTSPYYGSGTYEDPYLVGFLANDPTNPHGFSFVKKWSITMTTAFATLAIGFASSAYTGGSAEIIREFGVGSEEFTLGVSLFVLGFALGPLCWAPLSELYGRRIIFIISFSAFVLFGGLCPLSKNIETLIILRFFQGAFGSSPLTNSGGIIADMFDAKMRGLALSIFSAAPFMGPVLGPVVSGYVGVGLGWKWIFYIMTIFSFLNLVLHIAIIPETYTPVILGKRARKLTASSSSGLIYISETEQGKPATTVSQKFKTQMTLPFVLLFREPIVMSMSIWMAIIYGTLYGSFGGFAVVYQEGRGWEPGVAGLVFIPVGIGMIIGICMTFWFNNQYKKEVDKHGGRAPAEARLPMAKLGGVCVPISLFWFSWTTYNSVPWIVNLIALVPFGCGMVLVFLAVQNYMIDSYLLTAASVLAANAVLRSLFGFAFPLFTVQMYHALGTQWAGSLMAFLGLMCVPIPFLMYRYGPHIRSYSKYAPSDAEIDALIRSTQSHHKPMRRTEDDVEKGNSEEPTKEQQAIDAAEERTGERDPIS